MKIAGAYTIPAPRERVFALLVDEEVLRRCLPGCRRLVREGEDRFVATLEVGVGSVQGSYDGTVLLTERVPPERLAMQVEGKGKLGFVKGQGWLRLEVAADGREPGTRILYDGDVQVGGNIASVGQRLLQGSSKMMAGQFFAALEAEAKTAASAAGRPAAHGLLRNFFRWLWSLFRSLFR